MLNMSFTWKGETRFNLVLDAQKRWRRRSAQKQKFKGTSHLVTIQVRTPHLRASRCCGRSNRPYPNTRTPSPVLHASDEPSLGHGYPRSTRGLKATTVRGKTRPPGSKTLAYPKHRNRRCHGGLQRPHFQDKDQGRTIGPVTRVTHSKQRSTLQPRVTCRPMLPA